MFRTGDEQSVDGPAIDGNSDGGVMEPVTEGRVIRRRHGHTKQLPILPISSSASSATTTTTTTGVMEKTKNAVMLLNELQPGGLSYDHVIKSGPDHKPLYTASITIYGQVGINNSLIIRPYFHLHR